MRKKLIRAVARIYGVFATLPARLINPAIGKPSQTSHEDWIDYLSDNFNKPGLRVLEVGSRVVTGSNHRNKFDKTEYVGFDFHPGDNVDIVGDAHKLSSYFDEHEQFDLIFSSAVFEHLHMPWVCAYEIHKMLNVGGVVFIETHFSFGSHERPWHFYQFSDMGLRALFNDAMGFDLIESGLSNPMFGYFSHRAAPYLRYLPITELYCHSEILCQKREHIANFSWDSVAIDNIVEGTRYPLDKN